MIAPTEFNDAHAQWYNETAHHSFPWTICNGAGYEKMKAFGVASVPLLLGKLVEEKEARGRDEFAPVQAWGIFHLLGEFTGEDIFAGEVEDGFVKGHFDDTLNLWIEWGKKKGHIHAL